MDTLSKLVHQQPPLLRLPSEIRNYIWALSLHGIVVLRAERQGTGRGSRLVFHPERPALAAVNRQLSNEALSTYYAESIFYFADTMLWPDVMKAYQALRGNLLNYMQEVKVHHRPQLRFRSSPPGWDNDSSCEVRFTAFLENQKEVFLTDTEVTAVDRNGNLMRTPIGKREHCVCFIKSVLNRADADYEVPVLFQFLTSYVRGLQVAVHGDMLCEACGRKKTIQLRGACCGYLGGWP